EPPGNAEHDRHRRTQFIAQRAYTDSDGEARDFVDDILEIGRALRFQAAFARPAVLVGLRRLDRTRTDLEGLSRGRQRNDLANAAVVQTGLQKSSPDLVGPEHTGIDSTEAPIEGAECSRSRDVVEFERELTSDLQIVGDLRARPAGP